MEKGFRIVRCPEPCGKKLKLTITREDYGKTVEVTCPACSLKFTTTIPVPAPRNGGRASQHDDNNKKQEVCDSFLDELDRIFRGE